MQQNALNIIFQVQLNQQHLLHSVDNNNKKVRFKVKLKRLQWK